MLIYKNVNAFTYNILYIIGLMYRVRPRLTYQYTWVYINFDKSRFKNKSIRNWFTQVLLILDEAIL